MARRLAGVFAHPDDESRTVGGTLALAATAGVEPDRPLQRVVRFIRSVVKAHASQWALSPFDLTCGWAPWSVEHFRLARTAAGSKPADPLAELADLG